MNPYRTAADVPPRVKLIPVLEGQYHRCPICGGGFSARLYAQKGLYSYFICHRTIARYKMGCGYEWAVGPLVVTAWPFRKKVVSEVESLSPNGIPPQMEM